MIRTDLVEQAKAIKKGIREAVKYIPDEVALTQTPSLYDTWAANTEYEADSIIKHNGSLYRVVQAVTSLESQAPDAEGMLAIYRPIVIEAAGTLESPIPWVYGMVGPWAGFCAS